MADIVDRVRKTARYLESQLAPLNASYCDEAADEIERLRAALKPFADAAGEWDREDGSLHIQLLAYDDKPGPAVCVESFRVARAAIAKASAHD